MNIDTACMCTKRERAKLCSNNTLLQSAKDKLPT
uniref:Uncharacterized protein n=1 Tax=Arundo donax TaxID=35708 RepID=A0A0A8ZRY3_ARUDO